MDVHYDYSGHTIYDNNNIPAESLGIERALTTVNLHRAKLNRRPFDRHEFRKHLKGAGIGEDILNTIGNVLPMLTPLLTLL